MVGGELDQSEILFRHHRLLDPSMPECMEGIRGGVQFHLVQAVFEPFLKLVVQHWSELALEVSSLEHRRVRAYVRVADHAAQGVDCSDRAQNRAVVVPGERDLLDPLRILNSFSLMQCEQDSRDVAEVDGLDVAPAEEAFRVNVAVRLRDKRRAPEHCEEVQE